jgi:outer membrane protein OmpA-like peptidoglycan-associated protein
MKSSMCKVMAAVAAIAVAPLAASAEPFYVGASGGISMPRDSDLESGAFNVEAEQDIGWLGLINFGYEYGYGLRTELEFGYRKSDLDKIGGATAGGDVSVMSGMVNLIYDLDVSWPIMPYLGAGIGAGRVEADGASPVSTTSINDTDTGFAYQIMAGFEYGVTDQLMLNAGYRYFAVPDLTYTAANGASVDTDYASHNFTVGVRYLFGPRKKPAPAPAPVPAAAPAPRPQAQAAPTPAPAPAPVPRTYLVFFDHDSSQLTAAARSIIATAANNSKTAGTTRIIATGHTDKSGTNVYNDGLSQRRSNTVKAELVRLGVPANAIATVAKGESDPLVQTRDGVREPQNRRVEIVLQ